MDEKIKKEKAIKKKIQGFILYLLEEGIKNKTLILIICISIACLICNCLYERIAVFSVAGVLIGLDQAYKQWKKDIAIKRAEYLRELYENAEKDEDLLEIRQLLQYKEHWFDDSFFDKENIDKKRKIDKTLNFYSYICYLGYKEDLDRYETSFFDYELKCAMNNEQIKAYVYNLGESSKDKNATIPFWYFYYYGCESGAFKMDYLSEYDVWYIKKKIQRNKVR
ncbi:MAG: hypothetical protein IJM37_08505 [Lachnospiraceae bacterium]|nr:hypothetical protein [Lachnospiraceae bacterium]